MRPSSAPPPISRVGSTQGCWRAFGSSSAGAREVAACHSRRLGSGEQSLAPPPQPIGYQPNPFARGDIDATQSLGDLVEGPRQIRLATRAIVDRPRLDVEARLAKGADRARHVVG